MLFYFNCIVSVIGGKKKWKRWMQFYSFCERICRGVASVPSAGSVSSGGFFLGRRRGVNPPEKDKHSCVVDRTLTQEDKHTCAEALLEAWKIIQNSLASTTRGFMSSLYQVAVLGWISWTKCKLAEADGVPSWPRGNRLWWGSVSVMPFGPPSSGQAAVIHGPCRCELALSASAPWHSEPDTPSRKSDSDLC